jgi:hypothetical protein
MRMIYGRALLLMRGEIAVKPGQRASVCLLRDLAGFPVFWTSKHFSAMKSLDSNDR